MSDLYSVRKSGLLKLKGEKEKKKKSKKRKHEDKEHKESKKVKSADRQDALDHGGWWSATEFKHITGKNYLLKSSQREKGIYSFSSHSPYYVHHTLLLGPVALEINESYVKTQDDGGFDLGLKIEKGLF